MSEKGIEALIKALGLERNDPSADIQFVSECYRLVALDSVQKANTGLAGAALQAACALNQGTEFRGEKYPNQLPWVKEAYL